MRIMEQKNFTLYSDSAEKTQQLGRILAQVGKQGVVICLQGDLGAGKTTLTQGLAAELHCENASSPTFNLMNVYKGDITVYHFDLYRLGAEDELYDIGFYEYTQEDGDIIIIEWPDKFIDALPEDNLYIEISASQEIQREIKIKLNGQKYQPIYEELKQICQSWQ